MIFTKKNFFFFLFLIFISFQTNAQDSFFTELTWPREIKTDKGLVTYYQPQIDSYVANILEGRCALSYKPKGGEMAFGAFWFKAFLQTDKETRTATLDKIDILELQFPGVDDSTKMERAKESIQKQIEGMGITMSLDRLIASMDESKDVKELSDNIDNTPPQIFYREKPTILISVDGDPLWKELKDQGLEYVQNSPFFIVKDSKTGSYFINGDGNWYSKTSSGANWAVTNNVPNNIENFAAQNRPKEDTAKTEKEKKGKPESIVVPDVLVVYKPSELIVTGGEPDYKSIEGTSLLYVENSEDDILMDINSQMHYVLIAGRWYKSKTLADGSWTFQEPGDLPADFAKISEDSPMGDVLTSVPGTDASRDALLEQAIPQTAEVVRSEAKLEVQFDGDPQFQHISNTDVSYSINSDKSVLKIKQKYYCVDNGIWFVSNYPTGPWEVSDQRPPEVDQIPPTEPVYNTKYVYVYSSTPEVVYVGYLPGYTNSYIYNGVVVYGTGYYYPYWYGSVYYPRPVTYGYNVNYNPYIGWGFGMGYSYGWIGWGYHPYYRPYWGPCGYHAGYRNGYYNGYHHGYNNGYHNAYNRGAVDGYRTGSRNAYKNQSTGVRQTSSRDQMARANDISRPSKRPNNMYSDKKGNVYQRTDRGNWDKMQNKSGDKKISDRKNTHTRETPTRETPRRETPTRVTPTRETPTRETPTRDTPIPETPTHERPTRDTPPRDIPQRRIPTTRDAPVRQIPNTTPPSRQRPAPQLAPNPNLNKSYESRERGQQNYQRSNRQAAPAQRNVPQSRPSVPAGGGRRR